MEIKSEVYPIGLLSPQHSVHNIIFILFLGIREHISGIMGSSLGLIMYCLKKHSLRNNNNIFVNWK